MDSRGDSNKEEYVIQMKDKLLYLGNRVEMFAYASRSPSKCEI